MIGRSRLAGLALGFLGSAVFALAEVAPGDPASAVPAPSGASKAPQEQGAAASASSPAPSQPQTLWERDSLFGDLGGRRTWLADHGVAIAPTYIGEVMGNVSGGAGGYMGRGRGVIYESLLTVPVDVTLSKLVPGWDATVHADAMWIAGPGLSPSYVGDIGDTSNIQAYNTVRLHELWFQQNFWDQRISLKVGQIAADTEFFLTATGALFVNSVFGAPPLLGGNLPDPHDPNVYPMGASGVRLLVRPDPRFYVMAGVFNGTAESQVDNPHGTHFPLNPDSGALIVSEAGYLLNQGAEDKGLQGTYKVGSFVHTHNFNGWGSQTAAALGTGSVTSSGSDYGVYGIADQQLYFRDGRTVSAFARVGSAPSDVNVVDWYVDGGFNFAGFVPGRDNDVAGVAFARSMFSDHYSDYQVAANGTNPYGSETLVEATYKVQLSGWWYVQPDFQYIWTPSGQQGSPNAAVIGVRSGISF